MTILFQAHSGVRYLVLLLALVALLVSLYGFMARRPSGKTERVIMSTFTAVLGVQILLGLGLINTGISYGAHIGHLPMMILAAVAANGAATAARIIIVRCPMRAP